MITALLCFFTLLHAAPADAAAAVTTHNQAAMAAVDRGDLATAATEFAAAYAASPDPARDRAARESAMGSLRGVLLRQHAADPRDPAPLCRLRSHLRAHLDALVAAHPNQPDLLEIRGNEARLDEVERDLAAFDAAACAPKDPPPTLAAPDTAPARTTPSPIAASPAPTPPRPASPIPPRHLKIAGGVALGLAGAALGGMVWRIAAENSLHRDVDILESHGSGRFTPADRDALETLYSQARSSRLQAIGLGVAAAGLSAAGVTLLVAGRRAARGSRWSLGPWWLPTGGGLTLHMRLGTRPTGAP